MMKSNIKGSGISKSFGINSAHPNRISTASSFPYLLSFAEHVLRSRNSNGAIGPLLLFPKLNIKFCGSSSALFSPNLGTNSSLK